jgi:hypothetical protein
MIQHFLLCIQDHSYFSVWHLAKWLLIWFKGHWPLVNKKYILLLLWKVPSLILWQPFTFEKHSRAIQINSIINQMAHFYSLNSTTGYHSKHSRQIAPFIKTYWQLRTPSLPRPFLRMISVTPLKFLQSWTKLLLPFYTKHPTEWLNFHDILYGFTPHKKPLKFL